jgi:hypothetical protein
MILMHHVATALQGGSLPPHDFNLNFPEKQSVKTDKVVFSMKAASCNQTGTINHAHFLIDFNEVVHLCDLRVTINQAINHDVFFLKDETG